MKWLFAAAAAVCLFACGGPQDLTKVGRSSGAICNGVAGSPGCAPNDIAPAADRLIGTWCRSGAPAYKINVGSENATITSLPQYGTSRNSWNGCFMVGDLMWKGITFISPGQYSVLAELYSFASPCPGTLLYSGSSVVLTPGLTTADDTLYDGYSQASWSRCE